MTATTATASPGNPGDENRKSRMERLSKSGFKPAENFKTPLRLAIDGPSGSGKTFTALRAAFSLKPDDMPTSDWLVVVVNTESGAIQKYKNESPDGVPWKFYVDELTSYAPTSYTNKICLAGQVPADVIIVDSMSHAWEGEDGALDQVDKAKANSRSKNDFGAWRDVTPQHRRMIDAMLRSPCHVIVTMRTKMEYVLEEVNGKMVPKKVGMAPIQRAGTEYEFDVVLDMDASHTVHVSKTRCPAMDGLIVIKPGADFFKPLCDWLYDGVAAPTEYYAVTQDDLDRHDFVRNKGESTLPPVSPDEKRRRAEAKAAEAAKGVDSAKGVKAAATGGVTASQLAEIKSLGPQAFDDPKTEFGPLFANLCPGKKGPADLTESEALSLISAMSGIVSDKKLAKAHADFAAVDTGPDPACESDAVAAAKAEKAAAKAETEPAKGEAEPAKPAKPVKTTAVPEYASSEHRDLCNDCHEASSGLGMERADEIAWLKAMNVTSYRSLDMDVLRERMAYLLLVTRTCELADEAGYPNDKEDAMFKHFGVDQWWELDAKVIQDAHDKFAETVKAFETAAAD